MGEPSVVVAIASFLVIYGATVASLVTWLSNKFRHLERTFYRELSAHNKHYEGIVAAHGLRIQRLELKAFGFTEAPSTLPPITPLPPSES